MKTSDIKPEWTTTHDETYNGFYVELINLIEPDNVEIIRFANCENEVSAILLFEKKREEICQDNTLKSGKTSLRVMLKQGEIRFPIEHYDWTKGVMKEPYNYYITYSIQGQIQQDFPTIYQGKAEYQFKNLVQLLEIEPINKNNGSFVKLMEHDIQGDKILAEWPE